MRCSSGTYIRAIARDLGAALGVGGHLTALRRTAVGPFALDRARTLDELADEFAHAADRRGRARGVPGARPRRRRRPPTSASAARSTLELDGLTAVFAPDGEFLALYEPRDGRRPRRRGLRLSLIARVSRLHRRADLALPRRGPGRPRPGPSSSIGNFDGVHLGHQHVLARAREVADERRPRPSSR